MPLGKVRTFSGPTSVDCRQLAAAVMLAACCGMDGERLELNDQNSVFDLENAND
jgi:hypothetical protein